jgi:hypothetical protein
MRIIIIDGWHKGHVLDWRKPMPEIQLLRPKTVTVCDCDDFESIISGKPASEKDGERFEFPKEQITYKVAFTSPDGEVALFSTGGKSTDIFGAGFDRAFRDRPFGPNEVLYFGCHDAQAFR